jgi:uncharacterized membrane protein YsdA (DUF1294 family)
MLHQFRRKSNEAGKTALITPVFAKLGLVFVMNIVTFIVYGWDKRQAFSGGRRLPERTLHLLAFLGGWPGALMGQRHFRHKTKKVSFLIVFWFIVVLHIAVVGAVAYAVHSSSLVEADGSPRPISKG